MPLKIRIFDEVARKRRTENRSLCGINEDSSTTLTQLTRKKAIFRGAIEFKTKSFLLSFFSKKRPFSSDTGGSFKATNSVKADYVALRAPLKIAFLPKLNQAASASYSNPHLYRINSGS